MLRIRDNGKEFTLKKSFAKGGEGEVYPHPKESDLCIKILITTSKEKQEKLKLLSNKRYIPLHENFALPMRVVSDLNGNFCGYVMKRRKIVGELHTFTDPLDRRAQWSNVQPERVSDITFKLASAVSLAHKAGLVLGDLNPRNIGIDDKFNVFFFDSDNFEVKDEATGKIYRSTHGMTEFTDPMSRFGRTGFCFTQATDNYSLAILIFQIFSGGRHPFAGIVGRRRSNTPLTIEEMMEMGMYIDQECQTENLSLHGSIVDISKVLPAPFPLLFRQTFTSPTDASQRISPDVWAESIKTKGRSGRACSQKLGHFWFTKSTDCPHCKTARNLPPPPNQSSNRICLHGSCLKFAQSASDYCSNHEKLERLRSILRWGGPRPQPQTPHFQQPPPITFFDVCGARRNDGFSCQNPPAKGRKRCHHHYGMREA